MTIIFFQLREKLFLPLKNEWPRLVFLFSLQECAFEATGIFFFHKYMSMQKMSCASKREYILENYMIHSAELVSFREFTYI